MEKKKGLNKKSKKSNIDPKKKKSDLKEEKYKIHNLQKKDKHSTIHHDPNIIEKKMDIDILFFPKKKIVNPYENHMSPFKMFDFFRNVQDKPMNLERMTYEEIKMTNRLLREILYLMKK